MLQERSSKALSCSNLSIPAGILPSAAGLIMEMEKIVSILTIELRWGSIVDSERQILEVVPEEDGSLAWLAQEIVEPDKVLVFPVFLLLEVLQRLCQVGNHQFHS
jgi:hypothetical protein